MQRGTWVLAISGMMALYHNGYAADPASDLPSRRNSVGTARISGPRRGEEAAASGQPTAKNYYKDLFGEDERTPSAAAKRTTHQLRLLGRH